MPTVCNPHLLVLQTNSKAEPQTDCSVRYKKYSFTIKRDWNFIKPCLHASKCKCFLKQLFCVIFGTGQVLRIHTILMSRGNTNTSKNRSLSSDNLYHIRPTPPFPLELTVNRCSKSLLASNGGVQSWMVSRSLMLLYKCCSLPRLILSSSR